MSRQFRSDDTSPWNYGFGSGVNGTGSINTSTDAPIDSACSGTAGTISLTATNVSFASGQVILIHKTRGNTSANAGSWELNYIASYTAGTITTALPLQNTYVNSGADCSQVIVGPQYNDLTINNSQTLTAKAWNGTVGGIIFKLARGTFTSTGNIYLGGNNASGTTGGVGTGFSGSKSQAYPSAGYYGEGTGGVAAEGGSGAANGNGGGCGRSDTDAANHGGTGGGGGNRTAGGNGASAAGGCSWVGSGGAAVGNAAGTNINFGGGGGNSGNNVQPFSASGAGGGIAIIIASNIVLTGSINLNGGAASDWYNGSAGGAGGFCLLKAKTATLGTTLITALGSTSAYNSANGGNGGIHLDYKTSYTGTTNPTIDVTQDNTLDYVGGGSFLPFL